MRTWRWRVLPAPESQVLGSWVSKSRIGMEEAWRSEFAHFNHQDGPGIKKPEGTSYHSLAPNPFWSSVLPHMPSPKGTRCLYQFPLISDIPTDSQLCPAPSLTHKLHFIAFHFFCPVLIYLPAWQLFSGSRPWYDVFHCIDTFGNERGAATLHWDVEVGWGATRHTGMYVWSPNERSAMVLCICPLGKDVSIMIQGFLGVTRQSRDVCEAGKCWSNKPTNTYFLLSERYWYWLSSSTNAEYTYSLQTEAHNQPPPGWQRPVLGLTHMIEVSAKGKKHVSCCFHVNKHWETVMFSFSCFSQQNQLNSSTGI